MRWVRVRNASGSGVWAACVMCAAAMLIALPAQAQRGTSSKRADALIDLAIEALIDEARAAREQGRMLHADADFVDRWDRAEEIDRDALGRRILSRVDRDPFVDAYVRWQLTGFEPVLPDLDDRAFLRAMDAMPALVPNPAANPELVSLMQQADEAASLTDDERAYVRRVHEDMRKQVRIAEHLAGPAEAYRQWMDELNRDAPVRQHILLLEACAATIAAGWSTRSVKTRLTRAFTEWGAACDVEDEADMADRRAVVEIAQMLAGRENQFVNTVTFMANGTVNVRFSTARITQRDVDRWANLMYGRR